MAKRPSPREWWTNRRVARQAAQVPSQDLRVSPEAPEQTWATGVPEIPFSYYPTMTINPPRPRTIAAGYDYDREILRLKFRPGASSQSPGGAIYDYYGVTLEEWMEVMTTMSTGRYLNNQLAAKEYKRIY